MFADVVRNTSVEVSVFFFLFEKYFQNQIQTKQNNLSQEKAFFYFHKLFILTIYLKELNNLFFVGDKDEYLGTPINEI
jgi:hypothetical protein